MIQIAMNNVVLKGKKSCFKAKVVLKGKKKKKKKKKNTLNNVRYVIVPELNI